MTTDKNELSVNQSENQIVVIAGDLFKDIDFSGLNNTIENIANHNQDLTDGEKTMAMTIIGNWQTNVVKRLQEKQENMTSFLSFFDTKLKTRYYYSDEAADEEDILEEYGEDFANKTNTVSEYQLFMKKRGELEELKENSPEKPMFDLSATTEEKLEADKDYDLAKAKYNVRKSKLEHDVLKAERNWKKVMKESKDVKDLLSKAKKYTRNINKLKMQCQEKTDLAKLNVSISSKETRDSLKELLTFASNI